MRTIAPAPEVKALLETRDAIQRELFRCMGFPASAMEALYSSAEGIALKQIEITIETLQEWKTVWYIQNEYASKVDEGGSEIVVQVAYDLAKEWGAKNGLLVILHPDLVERCKGFLKMLGFRFCNLYRRDNDGTG